MAGEDIASGIPAELAKFSPVTGAMGAAQSGGQQLLELLMQLFQQQQTPQAPLPFAGQPQENQRDLRSRMINIPAGGTY